MFSVSKALTFLFLPPGIFVFLSLATLLLLLLALRALRGAAPSKVGTRLTRTAAILTALLAAGLYTLSIEPVSELLLRPLEQAHPPVQSIDIGSVEANAIVVLSGGTVTRSPEEEGRASPAAETLKRLSFAYRLHLASGLPIITSGGTPLSASGSGAEVAAGEAMGRYIVALGADPEAVYTEEASRNTFENAALIAEQYDHQRVILVTSAYHMPRSVWVFQQIGFQVLPAPTDYKIDADGYNLWSFFPSMGSFHDSYRALHEYVGIVYYLWRF